MLLYFKKEIPIPKEYFIIASNDVGTSLQDLIDNPSTLITKLIENWDTYCKTKITKTVEIPLDTLFLNYIKSFDFTIIKTYPIARIVDEYLDTIYGNIRFGGRRLSLPTTLTPTNTIEREEMPYISALLEAYSDELNIKIDTIKSLKAYSSYFKHLNRQRKDYYSAETIRRFVRDTLTDSQQFDVLKEEIYNGIIDTHEQEYDSGYKRLVADLQQAAVINTSIYKISVVSLSASGSRKNPSLDNAILNFCDKKHHSLSFAVFDDWQQNAGNDASIPLSHFEKSRRQQIWLLMPAVFLFLPFNPTSPCLPETPG